MIEAIVTEMSTFSDLSFHDLAMPSITGETISFEQFRGRRCLVVNVASR